MSENQFEQTLKEYKKPIVTGLLCFAFGSMIYSVRKNTKGTKDFGMSKLMEIKTIQQNPHYGAWIWATRAFVLSTSMVGIATVAGGYFAFEYLGVNNLKEFSKELRIRLRTNFPALAVEENLEREEEAMNAFNEEWKELSKEVYSDTAANNYITERVRSQLGKLVRKP